MNFLKYSAYALGAFIVVIMAKDLYATATYDVNEHAAALQKHAIDEAVKTRRIALTMAADACSEQIKRKMKNPNSFERIDYDSDGQNVYVNFYGTNSFNAVVAQTHACKI